ncbi:hypothetical protein HYU93_04970 [Candidatus Daviesbacteria bacterium]|nr:hypothetical protein [Candidatus Daviesbacteria bacterium]
MQLSAAKILAVTLISILSLYLTVKPTFATNSDRFMVKINQFRQSQGLQPIKPSPITCKFAAIRAKEASSQFTHDGFYNRVKNYTLPYPKYRLVTENLAWAPNGKDAVNMWINSPSHTANLLKNTEFACIEKYGDYYAFEGLQV